MVQTLTKIFNLNIDNNQIQLQVNNDYLDTEKKIFQLKQKVEETETSNKEYYKKCSDKEKEHLEKITNLEKKMTLFDKADVIMLQKQNNDYEIQIANLNRNLHNMTLKQTQDIEKYSNLIEELTTLKNRLNSELKFTNKIKNHLSEMKNKKFEVDIKTSQQIDIIEQYNQVERYNDFSYNVEEVRENKEKINTNIKRTKTINRKKKSTNMNNQYN